MLSNDGVQQDAPRPVAEIVAKLQAQRDAYATEHLLKDVSSERRIIRGRDEQAGATR